MLVGMSVAGPLPYGSMSVVAKKIDVSRATVSRLWKLATTCRSDDHGNNSSFPKDEIKSRKHERGRKQKWDPEAVKDAIKETPFKNRRTFQALASQLEVPPTTLRRMRKQQLICRHSSALKPSLTEDHKLKRVLYALEQRDPINKDYFQKFYDRVHVDEKQFAMTQDGEWYLLADGEEPPKRSVHHKGYINKVMFLCAQAQPWMVDGQMWNGKIGIWPVGKMSVAKRTSKNQQAGTPVWEGESMTCEIYC